MQGHRVDRVDDISVESTDPELILGALEKVDWSSKRKTAPLNILLPFTMLWARELPPRIRPLALMVRFPRIANLLAANWKEPTAFHSYMRGLLVDRRGGRQGFPPNIKHELGRLRACYRLRKSERSSVIEGDESLVPVAPDSAPHIRAN